jgi:integrase
MQRFRIGRLNGRYVVTWDDNGTRRRYRLDALTAKEAEAQALDKIREKTPALRGPSTVAALWEAYVAERQPRPIATTMGYTGKAVLAHFGALRPDQITTETCRAYAAARKAAGIAQGSVWTELGHLRSCLRWAAHSARLIDFAPHIERPQKPAPKSRHLTRAEIARLLAAPCEPHIRLAILFLLGTGARVGALLELTWDRVDFARAQIDLRLDAEGPRKGRAVVAMNAGLRVALLDAKRAALTDHVIEWTGKPVRSIRKGFARACTGAKLSGIGLHVLRHTAAVHMAEAGVSMDLISQVLGHSNVQITARVYARFSPGHMQAAVDVLDFGGALRSIEP